ncbi:PIN domain-containing protein [Spirochaetia bacterium]|nr:PIN domain-containing protein [Spirochaetia bacterium]GHU32029.1 PIN domain-containing protein [Spirochaetia bacterium]
MVILVDTNILLDFFQDRESFRKDAIKIIQLCSTHVVTGYIAAHSITNIFYILRKDYSPDKRKVMLLDMCRTMNVIGIDQQKLIESLVDESFDDIEDYLQFEYAASIGADYIVTRNTDDFSGSTIPAILPEEFLVKLEAVYG